jgi:peptidoglycan/xylan/chitin deacetylase (PgdA/CDA1 family)
MRLAVKSAKIRVAEIRIRERPCPLRSATVRVYNPPMLAGLGRALATGVLALIAAAAQPPANPDRRIAVTMDDLPIVTSSPDEQIRAGFVADLVAAIQRQQLPVTGFVNEGKLKIDGKDSPQRVGYLKLWLSAGLELGNHTFSHMDLHQASVEAFERDVLEGEIITRALQPAAGNRRRYFRHPYLHTGMSKEIRDRVEAFLSKHGYSIAPVTIDNADYVFAAAYDRAGLQQDHQTQRRIMEAYLKYMDAVFGYYQKQSLAIVGREIAHTLLLHANALNSRALDSLAIMLRGRGYRFVPLGEALEDPVYRMPDTYYGPGGISWLHRWAMTKGMAASVFAGEPSVPPWIDQASR